MPRRWRGFPGGAADQERMRVAIALCAVVLSTQWAQVAMAQTADRLGTAAARPSPIEILLRDGERRRAELLLERAIRRAPNDAVADRYGAALAQLHRRTPLQFGGSVNVRPSSNINRAASGRFFRTRLGTFAIEDGGRQRAGLGGTLSADATYRVPLDRRRTLAFSANLAREFHREKDLRQWRGTLRASMVARSRGQTLRFGAYAAKTRYDANRPGSATSADFRRYGLTGVWSADVGEVTRRLGVLLEYRDYEEQNRRDGPFASVNLSWSRPVGERGSMTWGTGIDRSVPDLDYQRYWGLNAQVGYAHLATENLRVGVSLSASFRRYDTSFAAVDFARSDDIWRVGVSATNRRIRVLGKVPTFRCTHVEQRSNIALYSTSYTDCGLSLSLEF